jgi:Cu/Ag efflux pump CusA
MWVSKKLLYVNLYALTLNALLLCLLAFKLWPLTLPGGALLVVLVGLWLAVDAITAALPRSN